VQDSENIEELIYEADLYPVRRLRNEDMETEETVWRVHTAREGIRDFIVDSSTLYDSKSLSQTLANKGGVYVSEDQTKNVRQYMIAYIKELQKKAQAHAQINHLGWTEDQTGFVLNNRIIKSDGTELPAVLGKSAAVAGASMGEVGSLAKQVEILRFYNRREYVAHQVLVLCGLAAPIFYATGQHGIIVNATGEPGASKSTAMMMAASLWAHPERYPISGLQRSATNLGRDKLASALSNLPVCVDEITNMDSLEASEMAYSITQPRGDRTKCGKDGELQSTSDNLRATIMVCTANSSLNNLLSQNNAAATAGAMRVVEMFFAKQRVHQKFEAEAAFRQLKQNYGWVGPAFIHGGRRAVLVGAVCSDHRRW
jgi:uncharacterized protein (DUF927 family)